MSEESVVEKPEGGPQAAPEESDAPEDDLQSLLSEWDEKEEKVEPKSEPKGTDDVKQVLAFVKQQQAEQVNTDILKAVDMIHEELGGKLGKRQIEYMLHGAAGKDSRIAYAFMKRRESPQAYDRMLKGLAKDWAKDLPDAPDRQVTQDRQAVAAAVRGASTSTSEEPDVPDFVGKSDQEFYAWLRSQAK